MEPHSDSTGVRPYRTCYPFASRFEYCIEYFETGKDKPGKESERRKERVTTVGQVRWLDEYDACHSDTIK